MKTNHNNLLHRRPFLIIRFLCNIFLLPFPCNSASINDYFSDININISNTSNAISLLSVNSFLNNYLQFNTSLPGSYIPNLTTNSSDIFNALKQTKLEFESSNMTQNSINAISSTTSSIYTNSLFNSFLLTPRVPSILPINQNYYLNFNPVFASNKFLVDDVIMKAGINFAMIVNYIFQPHELKKSEEQSDEEWLEKLSDTWSIISQQSISYHILHNSLKRRLSIEKLAEDFSASATNPIEEDTSYSELEEYQNFKRLHTQEWSTIINQSPEIILQRETLFAYAELARSLTLQYRQGQEILAAISGKISGQAGYVAAAQNIMSPDVPDVETPSPEPPSTPEIPESPPTTTPPIETPAPTPSGSGSSFCFISSTVFGKNSRETYALRKFRDKELQPYKICQELIITYYIMSPDLIEITNKEPIVNAIAKKHLKDLIQYSNY